MKCKKNFASNLLTDNQIWLKLFGGGGGGGGCTLCFTKPRGSGYRGVMLKEGCLEFPKLHNATFEEPLGS